VNGGIRGAGLIFSTAQSLRRIKLPNLLAFCKCRQRLNSNAQRIRNRLSFHRPTVFWDYMESMAAWDGCVEFGAHCQTMG
jgi:hypothetical protein